MLMRIRKTLCNRYSILKQFKRQFLNEFTIFLQILKYKVYIAKGNLNFKLYNEVLYVITVICMYDTTCDNEITK